MFVSKQWIVEAQHLGTVPVTGFQLELTNTGSLSPGPATCFLNLNLNLNLTVLR